MMSILRRGIKPEQKKEPALNRDIQVFTENIAVSRLIPEIRDIKDVSPEQIIQTARIAEIVDELDGKPLWEKLNLWRERCQGVAADAIDDEPYISSRLVLIIQHREDVASGLRLCGKALGVEREGQFAAVYHSLIAFGTKIPDGEDMKIRRFSGKYPIDLVEREKGEKNGILYIGAGAMVHLHRAVFEMRRQTTAFVTLAGDCVSAPFNAELPLGMPIKRALEFCGLSENPTYICTSGSLTAQPILDPETVFINPDTRAVLAFHRYDHIAPAPCIGCGRCAEVCPQQLPVFYLYRASLHSQLSLLRSLKYERCFECGSCTYVCPSHLDIVPVLRQGKEFVSASLREMPSPAPEQETMEQIAEVLDVPLLEEQTAVPAPEEKEQPAEKEGEVQESALEEDSRAELPAAAEPAEAQTPPVQEKNTSSKKPKKRSKNSGRKKKTQTEPVVSEQPEEVPAQTIAPEPEGPAMAMKETAQLFAPDLSVSSDDVQEKTKFDSSEEHMDKISAAESTLEKNPSESEPKEAAEPEAEESVSAAEEKEQTEEALKPEVIEPAAEPTSEPDERKPAEPKRRKKKKSASAPEMVPPAIEEKEGETETALPPPAEAAVPVSPEEGEKNDEQGTPRSPSADISTASSEDIQDIPASEIVRPRKAAARKVKPSSGTQEQTPKRALARPVARKAAVKHSPAPKAGQERTQEEVKL